MNNETNEINQEILDKIAIIGNSGITSDQSDENISDETEEIPE